MNDASTHPRSLLWLSRQETRLSWRDLVWLMTAGYRWRGRSVVIWLLVVAIEIGRAHV